jgi:hypothetical protein
MSNSGRRQSLWQRIVRYKTIIISIAICILGVIFMLIASSLATGRTYTELLVDLTRSGIDPGVAKTKLDEIANGPYATIVLWSIGGTLVSIGMIALAWDVWLHHSWLNLVREELVSALVNPETLRRIRKNRRVKLLEELLSVRHGSELGRALFRESCAMEQSARMMRKDFLYNIEVSPGTKQHHRANFLISFTVPRLQQPTTVYFSQVRDSLDFHARYQELIDSSPGAIYRYVLLSPTAIAHTQSFDISAARVESIASDDRFVLLKSRLGIQNELGTEFILEPTSKERRRLKSICEEECRVTLAISTVVDSTRNEFPIWLGYPVKNFRSRIVARAIATEVDVLEFFTSSSRFRREDVDYNTPDMKPQAQNADESVVWASGVLNDLILPNSGLTYIWR